MATKEEAKPARPATIEAKLESLLEGQKELIALNERFVELLAELTALLLPEAQ